ncbi:hypothetical protein [Paenibacillus larvae]|uniref:hypothetical protein n=1 Tax=Paenibacillus larvae TaxID=1464 RepID=UPI00288EA96F|nr:hypothetical protein [Paenibacillus larvae]MDT2191232.1 hypothetical protein [Paenibacillus larvae]
MKSLFDKDLFLSLYNPSYYFTLKWNEQRELLLRYVSAPANKEVFAQLPKQQAEKLGELVKKHSLADLEKIHRDNKNKKDKAYIAAQSRTKTLIEQLQLLPQSPPNLKNIQDDYDRFLAEIKVIDSMLPKADENNGKIIKLESQIEHLKEQRDQIKEQIRELHNEPIDDRCRACGQTLQGEAKAAAEADKQRRVDQLIEEFNNIITKRKELEAHLTQIEHIQTFPNSVKRLGSLKCALINWTKSLATIRVGSNCKGK